MEHLLNKLDLRQLYMLGGAAIFLMLTAFAVFVIQPMYERHESVHLELGSLRELDDSGPPASLKPLEAAVTDYERTLLGELQNVPTRQLESHIIAALQSSAWQSQINLVTVEPLETPEGLPYQEIAFRLEVEGRYFNLSDWVRQVTTSLGYVVFKEYALKVDKEGQDPLLSGRVLLAAYRVSEVP